MIMVLLSAVLLALAFAVTLFLYLRYRRISLAEKDVLNATINRLQTDLAAERNKPPRTVYRSAGPSTRKKKKKSVKRKSPAYARKKAKKKGARRPRSL